MHNLVFLMFVEKCITSFFLWLRKYSVSNVSRRKQKAKAEQEHQAFGTMTLKSMKIRSQQNSKGFQEKRNALYIVFVSAGSLQYCAASALAMGVRLIVDWHGENISKLSDIDNCQASAEMVKAASTLRKRLTVDVVTHTSGREKNTNPLQVKCLPDERSSPLHFIDAVLRTRRVVLGRGPGCARTP